MNQFKHRVSIVRIKKRSPVETKRNAMGPLRFWQHALNGSTGYSGV
jgi:hypothetical protein